MNFNEKITNYLNPDLVYIPIKKDCKLTVKTGDVINKEDIILCNENINIYSPVSGKVLGTTKMDVMGKETKVVVIENDFKEKLAKSFGTKRYINKYSKDEVIELLNRFNVDKSFFNSDKMLINGIDLEPYVINNSYLINEHITELLETIDAIYTIFDLKACVFAIKNNDTEVVDKLINHIGTYPNMELRLFPDLYPLEKNILTTKIYSRDEEIFYLNLKEVFTIYNILKRRRPICEQLITIVGDNLKNSGLFNVKTETSLKDIINNNLDLIDDNYRVIINGLMSGFEITNMNFIITPEVNSVFIMKRQQRLLKKCINCGMCHNKCPNYCDPRSGYKMENCFNCGICSYICPANNNFRKKVKK